MSAEDRRLSESVARTVMRVTHGVNQWDETLTVSTDRFRDLQFCKLFFLWRPIATDFKKRRADQLLSAVEQVDVLW
jgi:hypothetical protein